MTVHTLPNIRLTPPSEPEVSNPELRITLLLEVAAELRIAGVIDDAAHTAHKLAALEMLTGARMHSLRAQDHGYMTPSEIGRKLGVSTKAVADVLTEANLRQVYPGHATRVVHQKQDAWYLGWSYSPQAVERVKAHLSDRQLAS